MDEHLIFYIDFIGFADAIDRADDERLSPVIDLLKNFAGLRGEFDFTEEKSASGTQYKIRPAISTFSDHIVISYSTEHLHKMDGDDPFGVGLIMAQRLISRLAAVALRIGFLIRGGATVGPLYHSGGVVMGRAMVEAYHLESRVAIYPRIAVSRKLYSRVKTNPRSLILLEDHDGITHFNYFPSMILSPGEAGDDFRDRLNAWLAAARQLVAENIDDFERKEQWDRLAKWVWFRRHLESARSNIPDAIFEPPAAAQQIVGRERR